MKKIILLAAVLCLAGCGGGGISKEQQAADDAQTAEATRRAEYNFLVSSGNKYGHPITKIVDKDGNISATNN